MNNMASLYDPAEVEKKWYKYWEKQGYFHAEVDKDKKPYCIVIPPPNVTGQLHLGHALNNTLQDILIRFRRMQGYSALWMPGTDHAGIATQAKVEEMLMADEGLSRHDLGREAFLERVWLWKEKYGSHIIEQLKTMGCSCDWQRERFTMDEGCSAAVREVFVALYEKGLIYRGHRITNWCPRCMTALSDIEVEHVDSEGKIYYVRYPFVDNADEFITIATTRPETILGDTAVAVNPEDERYTNHIGRMLHLPGTNRIIPVVADSYVDKDFGSGAVKVTPAHDPNDFEIGIRHNLENMVVIGDNGKMTASAGDYAGLDRYECRAALLKAFDISGNLVKIEDHANSVGHCSRCDTIIEPLLSNQWFVKMAPLAERAATTVRDGEIEFIPERFTKTYLNWMDNIRDWCVSRQLWWGHRIPAWYCDSCEATIVARKDLIACPHCGGEVRQDSDVLDTWFSSALWPFSTLGWPNRTAELDYFYPTSVLVTGYDIIFFWVARMVFSGLEFMQDIPFKQVFLTGLVRDSQGRKMSKSLGNGIDPIEVIDQYGADAMRFALVSGNTPGNDMRFYLEKVESFRNFANKIWNASRFVLMNLEGYKHEAHDVPVDLHLADRWILSRLQATTEHLTRALDNYEPGEAARLLYDFMWDEFCDWYIEIAKIRLYDKVNPQPADTVRWVLHHVLEHTMRLLHPFMPFITEEIWHNLSDADSIMISQWPECNADFVNADAIADMAFIVESIRAIRNLRAEVNAQPGRKSEAIVFASGHESVLLQENAALFGALASSAPFTVCETNTLRIDDAMTAVVSNSEIYMPLRGLIDFDKEIARLQKEMTNLTKEVARLEGKLGNAGFVAKAPADVIVKEQNKLTEYKEKATLVQVRLFELVRLKSC